MIVLERLLLFLLLGLDWAADPTLLAPAVEPLAKPWCSTENVCPSRGYQRQLLRQSVPDQNSCRATPASGTTPPEAAADAAATIPALIPVHHLYVFMSLRR